MNKVLVILSDYTTFRMGGAGTLVTLSSMGEVKSFFDSEAEYVVLGGGSNILVADTPHGKPFVRINFTEITVDKETPQEVFVTAGAGVIWDDLVSFAVEKGLYGIELLAAIPGTVGAAPIQNIGAYGAEIKDSCEAVFVYNTLLQKFETLPASSCNFGYRSSRFQKEKEYIIVSVTFKLSKVSRHTLSYPSLASYIALHFEGKEVTLADRAGAVRDVRSGRLPDPKRIASVGSFFRNPHVEEALVNELKAKYPALPVYDTDTPGVKKLAAGWLIQMVHNTLPSHMPRFGLYDGNNLVIVHYGGGTLNEVCEVRDEIIAAVKNMFGVTLTVEPEIIA